MKFDVPVIWRQAMCHSVDCYFCLTKVQQHGRHRKVEYPEVHSMAKPVPHSPLVQYPVCPKRKKQPESSDKSTDKSNESFVEREEKIMPFTQSELNDLMRDLDLSKEKSEILASRLQERHMLSSGVKVTYYRDRHKRFSKYFSKTDNVCYCHDIIGLFKEFNELYDPIEWRLFVDSSKLSLKAVLLHQGNSKPSIPLAHAVNLKESYESMALLLNLISYKEHNWKVCADLKVVAMVTGLQQGYTKYMCFLCKWDSRARQDHYSRKVWPKRIDFTVGKENVKSEPLVKQEKCIIPPLHVKLGLFKNFVKALSKDGDSFRYLKSIFPNLSDAKIKEGVFVGPQIKKILGDDKFSSILSENELKAWDSFRRVVTCFLGNFRSLDYKEIIENLITNYEKIGVNFKMCISILCISLNYNYIF